MKLLTLALVSIATVHPTEFSHFLTVYKHLLVSHDRAVFLGDLSFLWEKAPSVLPFLHRQGLVIELEPLNQLHFHSYVEAKFLEVEDENHFFMLMHHEKHIRSLRGKT